MKKFIGNICVFTTLCIGIYFVSISPLTSPAQAGCRIECEQAMCGGEGYKGKAGKNGFNSEGQRSCTSCSEVCTPDPPAAVVPTVCTPVDIKCNTACGVSSSCMSNGCGGTSCCPATAACPTKIPPTPTPGNGCYYSPVTCVREPCFHVLVCLSPTPKLSPTPLYCLSSAGNQCPQGYDCIQPTMSPCVINGNPQLRGGEFMCKQMMPREICQISKCPKRPLGDANCDQLIDGTDFLEFKKAINNKPICLNCTVDFNNDKKVNLLDYEIWRRNK